MNRKNWKRFLLVGSACALLAVQMVTAPSQAATINYGDFAGSTLSYHAVTEDNSGPGPLFSAPTIVGDSLVFDPVGFASETNPGPGAHITDSQLSTVIRAHPGEQIESITVIERGDYTLIGIPDAIAQATVGAAFFVDIMEVNGVPRVDIPSIRQNMDFTGGGTYSLPDDGGTAVIWSGNITLDLSPGALGLDPGDQLTAVRLTFDNTLSTAASAAGSAFIKKKDLSGIIIIPNIPEPTGLALALIATLGLAVRRRR